MEFTPTHIPGVYIIQPTIHTDSRGYFMETYSEREFSAHIGDIKFVQDNESRSSRGVVRGLHFQLPPHAQSKLVRCTEGTVLDVAVDLRKDSPTFGQHISVELSAENKRQLFLPKGMAHGFAVLSEHATFVYKCDALYAPDFEGGIHPFDPALGIDWQTDREQAILSPKDLVRPLLVDIKESLTFKL